MIEYILPFFLYIFLPSLAQMISLNLQTSYLLKTVIVTVILGYFWKRYNLKFRWDFLAVTFGAIIFVIWVSLESLHSPVEVSSTFTSGAILIRLLGSVLVAPLVEELFTKSFLLRFLISPDKWRDVPIGRYTLFSFVATTLFFGFSHQRWLPGLITAVLLNLLLYYRKSVSLCVLAHATANLLLGVYVIFTGSWHFW
jgi:uncharacterized protein